MEREHEANNILVEATKALEIARSSASAIGWQRSTGQPLGMSFALWGWIIPRLPRVRWVHRLVATAAGFLEEMLLSGAACGVMAMSDLLIGRVMEPMYITPRVCVFILSFFAAFHLPYILFILGHRGRAVYFKDGYLTVEKLSKRHEARKESRNRLDDINMSLRLFWSVIVVSLKMFIPDDSIVM